MTISQFNRYQLVKTLDTDEIADLGAFQTARDSELKYVRLQIYIQGDLAGTERMRVKLFSRSDLAGLVATSEWSELSDLDPAPIANWIGFVRFDFAREFIDSDITYRLAVEIDDYTRNGDTLYVGVCLDQFDAINDVQGNGYPGRFELYDYKEKLVI